MEDTHTDSQHDQVPVEDYGAELEQAREENRCLRELVIRLSEIAIRNAMVKNSTAVIS